MQFQITHATEILERTPTLLTGFLTGLSPEWTFSNEGGDTWSAYDVMGHLIHGEKTDWIPRLKIILSSNDIKVFEKFDRFAQFENSKGKSLEDLLSEFTMLRKQNLATLKILFKEDEILKLEGTHPALGQVTAENLLSAWVVHDLTHIAQVARVMAKQYEKEVGAFKEYLGILNMKKSNE
jgi:hypothetical protein